MSMLRTRQLQHLWFFKGTVMFYKTIVMNFSEFEIAA